VRSSLLEILQPPSSPRADPLLLALGGADFDHHRASAERPAGSADERVDLPRRPSEGAGVLRGGAWEAGFAPLPGTLAEARGIARTFQDVFGRDASQLVLEGPGASTPALREGAHGARWLHLATHGWFAPESVRSRADPELVAEDDARWLRQDVGARVRSMSPMLLCGLALAGANLPAGPDGRIAGLVTAQELATLDLSSCELAVLSACDTNVGIRRAGQGVASLQRALHMAGARSVITSLWKVPDETTKELMLDFYRRMWVEKKPKWQALKEAKRKLRDAKDEHGDPKYGLRDWAAWVLTGEPD
jgi:CHAT domain-containing protein